MADDLHPRLRPMIEASTSRPEVQAAAVALVNRDRGGPALSWQCLDVAATDFTMSCPSVQADHVNAVMTCGFDALRDEGEVYGRRLREASVACSIVRWTGLTHGTNMFTALLPEALSCPDLVSSTLRRVHRS